MSPPNLLNALLHLSLLKKKKKKLVKNQCVDRSHGVMVKFLGSGARPPGISTLILQIISCGTLGSSLNSSDFSFLIYETGIIIGL